MNGSVGSQIEIGKRFAKKYSKLGQVVKTLISMLAVTLIACSVQAQDRDESSSPRIVNIINFIRQCEPRIERFTEEVLYETVVEQVNIMKRHQLKGTFLLQYDALMDARYQKLLKGLPPERFEILPPGDEERTFLSCRKALSLLLYGQED